MPYQDKRDRRAYREANKEKIKAYMKAYGKTYRQVNKERLSVRDKAYREANKEKINAQHRAYYKTNKDNPRVKENALRANVKRRFGITLEEYKEYMIVDTCYLCEEHIDTTKGRKVLHHNHNTGKICGATHDLCNFIEGHTKGNPYKLIKIATKLIATN